ncbi:MAG: pilin [Patescibacteria group bacterium]
MMKLKQIFAVLATMSMLAPSLVMAQVTPQVTPNDLGIQYGAATGLGQKDIRVTVASIIKTAMGLLGIVAVVIILIGGFKWMTAGGNEEGITEAKGWIFSGIIGLAIILSAYALATYVISSLVTATTGP